MNAYSLADSSVLERLNGIPAVDLAANLQPALQGGCRAGSVVWEIVRLRAGAGPLTPQEYFWYRLWDPALPAAAKCRFVGKRAQHRMHVACNNRLWFAAAADKLLFQSIMEDIGLPVPELRAVTQPGQIAPRGVPTIDNAGATATLLSITSADAFDPATDEVILLGGARVPVAQLAESLACGPGYLIQRRLQPAPALESRFGPRLWSLRALVLLRPSGPIIHRAVAKIATGDNPADNFWRAGNMLDAIELSSGVVTRTVSGTGADIRVNASHPDTHAPIVGTLIPDWDQATALVRVAAEPLPGIRTQSWDGRTHRQRPGAAGGEFRRRPQPRPVRPQRRRAGRDLRRAPEAERLPALSAGDGRMCHPRRQPRRQPRRRRRRLPARLSGGHQGRHLDVGVSARPHDSGRCRDGADQPRRQ